MAMSVAEADEWSDNYARFGWKRSQKENLWRRLPNGTRVTVFAHGNEFGFVVQTVGGLPRFSNRFWPTEDEAADAAMREANQA